MSERVDASRTIGRARPRRGTAARAIGIVWIGVAAGCFREDDAVARDEAVTETIGTDGGATTAEVEPAESDAGSGAGSGGSDGIDSTGAVVDCTLDAQCDDGNPCTIDVCEADDCERVDIDGLRAIDQVTGDCRVVVCDHGEPRDLADPTDIPDDANDCTLDGCLGDATTHEPAPAGLPCDGGVVCDGLGTCDECSSPDTCDGLPPDDDCQVRTCIDGQCGQSFAPAGAPLNATLQIPGDCRRWVCDGEGATTEEAAADPNIDGLECTADECSDGVAGHPVRPTGTPCAAGECDALGQCVGCSDATDCGIPVECQILTCNAMGLCGVTDVAAGTPLPGGAQASGNCQVLRCDGEGAVVAIADDDDLPPDLDACTDAVCIGGLAQHPDAPPGTACEVDGGTRCDGAGQCVVCLVAADCPTPAPCELARCDAGACGTEFAPAATTCSDGLFCTQSDACDGAGACVGIGDPCVGADADDDCSESCDELGDGCGAADPDGSPCDDGLACTAADTCTAGACGSDTIDCGGPGDCLAGCLACCDD